MIENSTVKRGHIIIYYEEPGSYSIILVEFHFSTYFPSYETGHHSWYIVFNSKIYLKNKYSFELVENTRKLKACETRPQITNQVVRKIPQRGGHIVGKRDIIIMNWEQKRRYSWLLACILLIKKKTKSYLAKFEFRVFVWTVEDCVSQNHFWVPI